MATERNDSTDNNRRTLLKLLGVATVGGAAGAAGLGQVAGDDDDGDADAEDGDNESDTNDESGANGETGEDDADDENDGGEESSDEDEPAPEGEPLTADEVREFIDIFDDQPMQGGQSDPYTPSHAWKWIGDDTFLLLHVDAENPKEAESLLYTGFGVKGTFCAETRPEGDEFTHFHQCFAETWAGAHGGDVGDNGYWLPHLAVDEFEMPWGEVTPGIDYEFMPTPPPECEAEVEPDFEPENSGPLTQDDIEVLNAFFDDEPMRGDQAEPYTPRHVWKWITEDVFMFLEYDTENPADATALEYIGIGVRGQFTEADQPHPDFTHFHQWYADSWDGAHGGDEGDHGYWLIHIAVDEFERPWGEVTPGVDRDYMPTPPPGVQDPDDEEEETDEDEEEVVDDEDDVVDDEEDVVDDEPAATVETTATDDDEQPFAFDPGEVEISLGETVEWVNADDVFHTVTSTESLDELTPSGLFDVELGSEGATFEFTFEEAGTYHYYCKPHVPFMIGTVHVEG